MATLDRFRTAQDDRYAGFDAALAELRAGRKRGHWIWYVFPQLSGLGLSQASQTFGLDGTAEASDYLRDATLRTRLLTITRTVAEQLRAGVTLERLMASSVDVKKLVSSLTLFGAVAGRLQAAEPLQDYEDLTRLADEVLAAAAAQGHPACAFTQARVRQEQ